MTDTQDLIARLRDIASKGVSVWGDLQKEAADALEASDTKAAMQKGLIDGLLVKLEAAHTEIERLKAVTFEPVELAEYGIKTPTPREFGARITERLEKKWLAVVEKVQAERDAALERLAELEKQEPVATVLLHEGEKIIDGTMAFMDKAPLGMGLYTAAGASPEPSALQAENAKLITALAACRDAFPVPDAGSELDGWYVGAIADPLEAPEYVKACVGASPQQEIVSIPGMPTGMGNEPEDAQPSQAGEPYASAKTWCEYVAGMVGCYLGEPLESDKCKAIAGIIGRRLWALPMPSQAGGGYTWGKGKPITQEDPEAINAKGVS